MALDSQQKRMAVAGRVFPSSMNVGQRPAVGNSYPVAIFATPIAAALFIIYTLDTVFGNLFLDTDSSPFIYLDTDETSTLYLDVEITLPRGT